MAFVRVEQRNAHLAGPVRLHTVAGREGPISKATFTAISNTRRGGRGEGDNRGEESTAIQWTLWGKQADNAAVYLGKGSHINVVGRVQNNNYEKEGETVYTMVFTAEEVDYLDTKAVGEALRARQGGAPGQGAEAGGAQDTPQTPAQAEGATAAKPARSRKPGGSGSGSSKAAADAAADSVPF